MRFTVFILALLSTNTLSEELQTVSEEQQSIEVLSPGKLRTNLIASVRKIANTYAPPTQGKLAPESIEAAKDLVKGEVIPIINQLLEVPQLKDDAQWAKRLTDHLKLAQNFVNGRIFRARDFEQLLTGLENFGALIYWLN